MKWDEMRWDDTRQSSGSMIYETKNPNDDEDDNYDDDDDNNDGDTRPALGLFVTCDK